MRAEGWMNVRKHNAYVGCRHNNIYQGQFQQRCNFCITAKTYYY